MSSLGQPGAPQRSPPASGSRFDCGNAVVAIAAAAELGSDPDTAADAMTNIEQVVVHYRILYDGQHEVRLSHADIPPLTVAPRRRLRPSAPAEDRPPLDGARTDRPPQRTVADHSFRP
ncbi:MAG: hypothetical protein ACR2GH_07120 [Pseudonocardia sp.]